MQMFHSCLGTSAALRSSILQPTARAHDVAQRFQQYAHWLPFVAYDMKYETMWNNPTAEVQRLAQKLGMSSLTLPQAQNVVDSVENLTKRSTHKIKDSLHKVWDQESGFSSEHIHQVTTRPGAHTNPGALVDVSLKLPSCSLTHAMDHIHLGWGKWLKDHDYPIVDNNMTQNLFIDSLPDTPNRIWPRIVHLVVCENNQEVHDSLIAAARVANEEFLVDIEIIRVITDNINTTYHSLTGICQVPRLTTDQVVSCGREIETDFILLSTSQIRTTKTQAYEYVRTLVADERLPLSRGFSLVASDADKSSTFWRSHALLLLPATWHLKKEIPMTARGWGVALLTHVTETQGQIFVVSNQEQYFTLTSNNHRDSRGVLIKALSGPNVLRRCCCPIPNENERPPRLDHNSIIVPWLNGIPQEEATARELELTRCGALLHAADYALAAETKGAVHDWCQKVIDEKKDFFDYCSDTLQTKQTRKRPPLEEDQKVSSALRVLLVRDVWPTQLEGADIRILRLVDWLSHELGFLVSLALPSGTPRGTPPWPRIRDVYPLERCPSYSDFDIVLLEFSTIVTRPKKPAAIDALERINRDWRRKQVTPPRNVILISWELHYHLTAALGRDTKHAALVYAYERSAYTSTLVHAVFTQSSDTARAFSEIQTLVGNEYRPLIFSAPVRTIVQTPDTIRAHLSTIKNRHDNVIFFGAHSAASQSALNWLLTQGWPALKKVRSSIKLILSGAAEFKEIVSNDNNILYEADTSYAISISRILVLPPASNRLLVPSASTQVLFALENGVPILAPTNASLGGIFDSFTGHPALDYKQKFSPVSFFAAEDVPDFVSQAQILLKDDSVWHDKATAALDLALRLSSSPEWALDGPLATYLRGGKTILHDGATLHNHSLDEASSLRGSELEDSLVSALALRPLLRATFASAAMVRGRSTSTSFVVNKMARLV